MRKRSLIGTGAIIACVVGAIYRSRTTKRTPGPITAVARAKPHRKRAGGISSLIVLWYWTIFAIGVPKPWEPVIDLFGGVGQAVKDLIRQTADAIYNYIAQVFGAAITIIETLIDGAAAAFHTIVGFLTEFAKSISSALFSVVLNLTAAIVNTTISLARSMGELFQKAMDFAREVGHAAYTLVTNAVRDIYNNWIAPIFASIWDILKWVPEQIGNAINWVNQNLVQPVLNFAKDLARYVWELWEWFIRTARSAVEMVGKAAWLLILAISYGPDYWISWITEQVNRLPQIIVGLAENAVSKEGSRIESWLVKWLGM